MTTDPYLIPGTDCLSNRLGLSDAGQLAIAESEIVGVRDAQLAGRYLPGKYDLQHLQAFHRRLFGDVYIWAGSLRSVELYKGRTVFVARSRLRPAGEGLLAEVSNKGMLVGLRREVMLDELAALLSGLNFLHPFREGNGRTQRAFLRQLAASAGWDLDWSGLDREENNRASAESISGSDCVLRALLEHRLHRKSPSSRPSR